MKKIIRLTESDLHNIIQGSVKRILREHDETLLLQSIAQALANENEIYARKGENDVEVEIGNGMTAYIDFTLYSDPYRTDDTRDVQGTLEDNPSIDVDNIVVYDEDDNEINLQDNGIIRDAILAKMDIEYDGDVPSEREYYDEINNDF